MGLDTDTEPRPTRETEPPFDCEREQLCPACGRPWSDHPDPSLAREWSVCTSTAGERLTGGGASRRHLLVLGVCLILVALAASCAVLAAGGGL